jgi:hypothetical protein
MLLVLRRWRALLLMLALVSLAFGMAGGLARFTPMPVSIGALALHGPLMVCAFFGTLISLERAAALERAWAFAAPVCSGLGGLLLLLGLLREGFLLMALAAVLLVLSSLLQLKRPGPLETAISTGGALAWLIGNLSVMLGASAVPWWIAFLVLTIGGERLHELKRGPVANSAFMALAAGVFAGPLEPRLLGAVLLLLALWFFAFGRARLMLRQTGRPRYVALCSLAGYFWLAVAGALVALSIGYDAALHAVFLGFVFSMVFAHAPLPYAGMLYAPLILLHASLAVRVGVSPEIGAWGNAAAIVLFMASAAALIVSRSWSGRSI